MCRLLGREAEALLGIRDQELTHPDDRQADLDAARCVLAGDIATFQAEKRFRRPGGEVVWAIANLTFLRDEAGLHDRSPDLALAAADAALYEVKRAGGNGCMASTTGAEAMPGSPGMTAHPRTCAMTHRPVVYNGPSQAHRETSP